MMHKRITIVSIILILAFNIPTYVFAQFKPTAEIISNDTAYCVTGAPKLTIRFTGTPPFGISYKSGNTTLSINHQSDAIYSNIVTFSLNTITESTTVTLLEVFDGTITQTPDPINPLDPYWPLNTGIGGTILGKPMSIWVDKMPNPSAASNTINCGYTIQLNGVKSKSSNTSLWWSESISSFSDNTIEKPTVTVPTQGTYKFWFKEIEGTCKDSVTITELFYGYATATLSGISEFCGNGEVPTSLTTIGNYPLTYKYTDGTTVSNPITVYTSPFDLLVHSVGSQTYLISSVIDKNNCATPTEELLGSASGVDLTPKPSVGTTQTVCANSIIVTATIDVPNGKWTSNDGVFDDVNAPITKFTANNWGESTVAWGESRKGCSGSATQVHEFQKQPTAIAGPTQTLFLETEATLAATPLDYGVGTWSSVATNIEILSPEQHNTAVRGLNLGETTFKWKVTNGICPSDSAMVIINVKDFTFSGGFTPNGDGINDVFEIFGLKQRPVANNELKVFDPAGRLVYSQQDYDNIWDGTDLSGKKLPDGPYYFFFTGDGFTPVKGYVIIKSE